jgi:hypothetical protein
MACFILSAERDFPLAGDTQLGGGHPWTPWCAAATRAIDELDGPAATAASCAALANRFAGILINRSQNPSTVCHTSMGMGSCILV